MAFNFKKAAVAKVDLIESAKREVRRARVQPDKLFIVYVMPTYDLIEDKKGNLPFNIRVWSRIDQRYIYNKYVRNADFGMNEALREYKKGKSLVIDIRTETRTTLEQKYRMRFY